MNTHPHIAARFITSICTQTLLEAATSTELSGRKYRLLRAVIFAELGYRTGQRDPVKLWTWYETVWKEIFGKSRPIPPGFRSPSEAWPHERHWVRLDRAN